MSRSSRRSSASPSLPDEGYEEQRVEVPKWAQHWSEEQRAELAIQLLKSVSPSLFSRTYARLAPLYEYRDFLVLLPYELTVHLLSFLDARSLVNVALVSKAWNRFASENAVWKKLYFANGWTVNQEMIAWYMRSSVYQDTTSTHEQSRTGFSISHGKRKIVDLDMSDARERECEDYEMLQAPNEADEMDYDHLHRFTRRCSNSPIPYELGDDIVMMRPADESDDPDSSSHVHAAQPLDQAPEDSASVSSSVMRPQAGATRTPTQSQRHRFSMPSTPFLPTFPRGRLPTYTFGNSLMTPPSMLKRMSQRSNTPTQIRIPGLSLGNSSASRPSKFFGHGPNSPELGHPTLQTSPTMPGSPPPVPSSPHSSGAHSPLAAKSLWSVIRQGVMGVSGPSTWPLMHSNRHPDDIDVDPGQGSSSSSGHHQGHSHHLHLPPSLPSWLMHLPSPLTTTSRHQRAATTSHPRSPMAISALQLENLSDPVPRTIDYNAPDAPLPSNILSLKVLKIHRDPQTHQAMINWKFLYKQRKQLEQNWAHGVHSAQLLPGHAEGIYCIQFDERKIASGSRDNTIKIWNLATGACLRTYHGHSASVLCLQYDDDKIVSGGSDTNIIVRDLQTGKIIRTLEGHADSVLSLRLEKDTVVSCSKDRTVKIWKISTGELVRTLVGHRAAVNAVQFSPESSETIYMGHQRVVVSASGDRSVKIWSFETGECLRTLEGHTRGIACIQFEGNIIISGSSDKSIKIWDIARGECIRTLVGHEDLVRTLQFSNGRIISGGYDETIKIWDQESGTVVANLEGGHSHRVFKLQFNDSKIVSCSQDQKIVIWDFAVGLDTTFLI
ncbi:hypothetical protein MVEG_03621 [Podila verticillata NRRL 6337]|nr:hypothetical protein MVEG_03621 [Podila verticillata NRRL 6337]